MRIYVGTSGYGYKEWKGIFYPEKCSPREMLGFYSKRLGAVEINNTFYHMPTERILASWAEQVPEGFIFALKAPQVITHMKRLKDVENETEYLVRTLPVLGRKLGPLLFQFPKSFRPDSESLAAFLALIPIDMPCALELRSPSQPDPKVRDVISENGCSLCTADSDENPADDIIRTTSWGYLRLRRSDYKDADLSRWMERIVSQKWEKAFVFFKHEGEAEGPEQAIRFQNLAAAMGHVGMAGPRGP